MLGSDYLLFVTDDGGTQAETNSGNDVVAQAISISVTAALGISLGASQVTEGGSVTATLTRNASPDTPLSVTLSESDPVGTLTAFNLPAVTIPAGQTSVTVTLPTIQNSVIEKPKLVTLTASATGYPASSAMITVSPDNIPNLSLVIAPASFGKMAGRQCRRSGPSAATSSRTSR